MVRRVCDRSFNAKLMEEFDVLDVIRASELQENEDQATRKFLRREYARLVGTTEDQSEKFDSLAAMMRELKQTLSQLSNQLGIRPIDAESSQQALPVTYSSDPSIRDAHSRFPLDNSKSLLPEFDGSNASDWLSEVERFFSVRRYSDLDKLDLVAFSLEGDVLLWFDREMTSRECHSWDEFRRRLLLRFGAAPEESPDNHLFAIEQTEMKEVLKLREPMGLENNKPAVLRVETGSFCQLFSEETSKPWGHQQTFTSKPVASVHSLSFEVGTEETMSSGLSQNRQVWEPGGVLADHVLREVICVWAEHSADIFETEVDIEGTGTWIVTSHPANKISIDCIKLENAVLHLKKSIYGLTQASRQWYLKFSTTLMALGFTNSFPEQMFHRQHNSSSLWHRWKRKPLFLLHFWTKHSWCQRLFLLSGLMMCGTVSSWFSGSIVVLQFETGTTANKDLDVQLTERDLMLSHIHQYVQRAQDVMNRMADTKRRAVEFSVRDWFYLQLQRYRHLSVILRLTQKLAATYFDTFQVLERIGMVVYWLCLHDVSKIHAVFHVSHLQAMIGDHHKVQTSALAELLEEELLVPETIVDICLDDVGRRAFMFQWQHQYSSTNSRMLSKAFVSLHSTFKLEDKLIFQGGSIDMNHRKNKKRLAVAHGE